MRLFRVAILAMVLVCSSSYLVFSQEGLTPTTIMEEIQAIAQKPLWPGFNPAKYPVAFFDGNNTLLFNFPGTPEGFTETDSGMLVFTGRHPLMVANTSATLDKISIATVILESVKDKSLSKIAGLTVHELFHVYANEEHGGFGANEALLFTYPFTDLDALSQRLMESEAMKRAYASGDPAEADGWTMRALLLRMKRADIIGSRYMGYERAQEKNEGLAQYIEDRAADSNPAERMQAEGWAAEKVRARCYPAGQFWAERLDVSLPEWKGLFNIGAYADLDVMLLIAMTQEQVQPMEFSDSEKASFKSRAETAVQAYKAKLASEQKEFESLPGWRIEVVVEEGAHLLAPRGFDPLNVLSLGDGLVLHTRMLNLGNNQGLASMLNNRAISFGPNSHPLFNGVRRVTFAGIEDEPTIEENGDSVKITSEGVNIAFNNAAVEKSGTHTIRLLLKPLVQ